MTTIRYFIPEDGDTEICPNVFLAPKPRTPGMPPTLGELKMSFPLPGRYHFRFKCPIVPGGDHRDPKGSHSQSSMAIWMDCVDDRQSVPTWKNSIMAKVTRIGIEDDGDDDDDDADDDFVHLPTTVPSSHSMPSLSATTTTHNHHSRHSMSRSPPTIPASQSHNSGSFKNSNHEQHRSQPSFDMFDGPTPSMQSHQSAPPSAASGNNLLDGHEPSGGSGSGALAQDSSSFFDMSGPVHSSSVTSSSAPAHMDFFGMTASSTSTPAASTTSTSNTTARTTTSPTPIIPSSTPALSKPVPTPPTSGGYNPTHQMHRSSNHNQYGMSSSLPPVNSNSNSSINGNPFGDLGTPWK